MSDLAAAGRVIREVWVQDRSADLDAARALLPPTFEVRLRHVAAVPPGGLPANVVYLPAEAPAEQSAPQARLASAIARAIRRIPDPEACRSPGLTETLLARGSYLHPEPSAGAGEAGMLMLKPGTSATAETIDALEHRCAEAGYVVRAARRWGGEEIRRRRLVQQHYSAHFDMSRRGTLDAYDRLRLLELFDQPEFEERFGVRARDVEVVPADRFVAGDPRRRRAVELELDRIGALHGLRRRCIDCPNEISDYKWVHPFVHPRLTGGRPIFLVNAHLDALRRSFEEPGATCLAFRLQAVSAVALPWTEMRTLFCGATDPARAVIGSLRRDALEGIFPLCRRDGSKVTRVHNGVHMSNGPIESLRELALWFGAAPEETPLGRELARAGLSPHDLIEKPYLDLGGRRRVLVEFLKAMSIPEVVRLLEAGSPRSGGRPAASRSVLRRIDHLSRCGRRFAGEPGVVAVLLNGAAVQRRLTDEDVTFLVVASRSRRGDTVACPHGGGHRVAWLTIAEIERRFKSSARSAAERTRAAEVGHALPIWDPDERCVGWERRAFAHRLPARLPTVIEAKGRSR